MRLSKLAFECVKNTINLPTNKNLNYISFLRGEYDSIRDYTLQIGGVFTALNLAIARLVTYNKIAFLTETITIEPRRLYQIVKFEKGQVVNIVVITSDGYRRVEFRNLNAKEYMVSLATNKETEALVEYRPHLPFFTLEDIRISDIATEVIYNENDIELTDLGITDLMCNYLIEFVKGQLLEPMDANLASLHTSRAEQYLAQMPTYSTSFYQKNTRNKNYGL